jgi:hypothetical protein
MWLGFPLKVHQIVPQSEPSLLQHIFLSHSVDVNTQSSSIEIYGTTHQKPRQPFHCSITSVHHIS